MNNLPEFKFSGHEFNYIMQGDQPQFSGVDTCRCLGLANPNSSMALLDEDEKGYHTVATPGGPQTKTFITEAGLYSLILRSRKPEAKEFKRWITHEVLPALRKTGGYVVALPDDTAEAVGQRAIQAGLDAIERLQKMVAERNNQIAVIAPKADVFDEHCSRQMTLGKFTKTLKGVHQGQVKSSLFRAGILYIANGGYRVYSQYRDTHFEEKASGYSNGKYDIFILPKGKELVTRLYKKHQLTMKLGFEKAA